MITGAIFDMDGLMFDSERIVYEGWQKYMTDAGYNYNLDTFKKTIGLRVDKTEKLYKSIYGQNFDYNNFRNKARSNFLNTIHTNGVPIKTGLFEILHFLKSKNIKLAVATSTSAKTAIQTLKLAKVYDLFDDFVCGDEVVYSKPHPQIFLTAASKLNCNANQCIAFEDSINGIKSAYAAQMITVMVPDYLQPTDEIKPMISYLCKDLKVAIDDISCIL